MHCPRGCKEEIKYREVNDHLAQCDGEVRSKEESKQIIEDKKLKRILFALDREKPEIIRFDIQNKSRIKISVLFTRNGKTPFPNLFQLVFVRNLNRMFVTGGSNHMVNKVEEWNIIEVRR